MLDGKYRLRNGKDIARVFKFGKPFHKGSLLLKVVDNRLKNPRFTVVVSAKTLKKAVDRNKTRRLIYGAVGKNIHKLKLNKDIVVWVKKPPNKNDYLQLDGFIVNLLK